MNLVKLVEFIFVIMILVFMAILAIFIVLCAEIYTFMCNISAPMYLRVITLSLMALVFIYIIKAIISKADDFKKF